MRRVSKDSFNDVIFNKYCEWMREQYLDNPNRRTIHPHEYVWKIIELVKHEQNKSVKELKQDKIY